MLVKTKYLIIGSSAAGTSAANTISRLEKGADVLCVTSESAKPYNKCFLVDWVSKEKTQDQMNLVLNDNVRIMYDSKVESLSAKSQCVYLENGTKIQYEKILLSIGVSANIPTVEGFDQDHVFSFHTYADCKKLINFIDDKKPQNAVVIGSGLTGLECADALMLRGLQVSVVERSEYVLGRHVDVDGAQSLEKFMQNSGVAFYGNQEVVEVLAKGVLLKTGKILPADLVVFAVGVKPNQIKTLDQDLECLNGYVRVDEYLNTNLPNVWAAGDMIVVPDILTKELVPSCSWPDAMMQGALVAQNMLGKMRKYPGVLAVANSHFFGKDFISCGALVGHNSSVDNSSIGYQKYILSDQKMVKGFLLIGDASKYPILRRSILTSTPWTC